MEPATSPAETQDLRAKILAQPDLKTVDVEVSEWGMTLKVRSLTATERSGFERSMNFDPQGNPRNLENLQTRLAVLTVVNGDGERVFTDDDVEALAGKHAGALQKIFNAAAELNGLTKEAADALAGNSEAG